MFSAPPLLASWARAAPDTSMAAAVAWGASARIRGRRRFTARGWQHGACQHGEAATEGLRGAGCAKVSTDIVTGAARRQSGKRSLHETAGRRVARGLRRRDASSPASPAFVVFGPARRLARSLLCEPSHALAAPVLARSFDLLHRLRREGCRRHADRRKLRGGL